MARLHLFVPALFALLAFTPPAHASRPWRAPVAGPLTHASRLWRAPVDGPVTRGFELGADLFEPGQHRGADFAAPAGATVRAACTGRVVVAGRIGTSGRVVTIRCGRLRATHMPLATLAVHAGETIRRGTPIGTVAPSAQHHGLHLGARREGSRFGYADPLALIGADQHTPPPFAAPARDQDRTRRPLRHEIAQPDHAAATPPAVGSSPVAPWPVWAGLALVLAGAVGTGVRIRVRVRRAPVPPGLAREVP